LKRLLLHFSKSSKMLLNKHFSSQGSRLKK
jgi:hypothetical protein